ncbi:MAG: hypothetical protein ACRDV0_05585, partial [Acidimicrobiales bacterium]
MSTPLPEASLGPSWRRPSPSQWAVIALTVTGVAAIVVQFALYGNFLLKWNYDTGVYFGATLHTWNGVFPYRDFIFVQPPGITLALAPAAFLQFAIGSGAGIETARVLTLVVVVANVSMVAYVLRRWGVVAQATGGLLMAAWPQLVALDWPITMDPFLVLFCLLALECLLRSWEEPDVETRRAWQAGVLIG